MSKIDITHNIQKVHEDEIMQGLANEVQEELKNGIPTELQQELDNLLKKANKPKILHKNNILAFKPRKNYTQQIINSFESVELLAAAGQNLGDWFSTPITFTEYGFILDIRKVIDSENEVDLYISPYQDNSEKMAQSLSNYTSQEINIIVSNDDAVLLEASLYVDETGTIAEGNGYLLEIDQTYSIKGKLSIDILDSTNN